MAKKLAELNAVVPVEARGRALAEMTRAEALSATAAQGLEHLQALLSLPVARSIEDVDAHPRAYRLIGDMAVAANKMLTDTGEAAGRYARDKALAEILEQIAADRAAEKLAGKD